MGGRGQDKVMELWSWLVSSLWDGPTWNRCQAIAVLWVASGCFTYWFFFKSARCGKRLLKNAIFKRVRLCIKRSLLLYWPEPLLILEQLFKAQRYGRRISTAARQELQQEEERDPKTKKSKGSVE